MSKSRTWIYSELLPNIRQISVIATLNTPSDGTTKTLFSADGSKFSIFHDGVRSEATLPGDVSIDAQLQKPAIGVKELSWRLPLRSAPSAREKEQLQSIETPWSAKDLDENSEFACRNCQTVIIGKGTIESWKDLPSANWAEMMEFWHCHKPDVPDHEHGGHDVDGSSGQDTSHNEDPNAKRGYGANTKFIARPGVAFVDATTFLISSTDCPGVEVRNGFHSQSLFLIFCRGCQQYIGQVDGQAEGFRLYKWRLSSTNSMNPISVPTSLSPPPLSYFVAAQFMQVLHSQCTSRVLLSPIEWKRSRSSAELFVSIWIFSPGLRHSSSKLAIEGRPLPTGRLAMKIFWNPITEEDAVRLQDRQDTEELSLPLETLRELETSLRDSAAILPLSARKFQGWNVGLLERYEDRR
ncbi:ubiquitin-conjugating enzyme E2-binding protein [Amylocarpus encephaloides]|uniref:Ubiquitin-conjugating enzyme E2-binding protein n=1 Tax=Amylocarpus encephaloides TaxID=45428 RepID=A0A9P8C0P3_9HELO|nr:ubiquitin-conjugating enzyme E2-binding protein [Amylocarpus encephaloides]